MTENGRGKKSERLSGWGRTFWPGRSIASDDLERDSRDAVLFRGLGRSYGDSAIPPPSQPVVISTPLADRIRFFDRETGRLRAEAGLSLVELNRLFLREGWFVPVTPGTQYVTLGGMVAADVHGKNHHVDGCFGEHLTSLRMRTADGRIVECSMENEPELFRATIGGMGLAGHILEVEFVMGRIPSPWIWQETMRINGIDNFVEELKTAARDWPFTMGWVDCLSRGKAMGRGRLYRGRWATQEETGGRPLPVRHPIDVPFTWPQSVLNRWAMRVFNSFIYWGNLPSMNLGLVHPEKFFYPLDWLQNWNRIYGPKGFTQYQCVLPKDGPADLPMRFFDLLTGLGGASFLCVIKDCGAEGRGMISFPMPGISIALDIPLRPFTQRMVDSLNDFVAEAGGRIYLCKDTFTRPEHYQAMEPRLAAWMEVRRKWDPEGKIRSAQSVRLMGDRP